MTQDGPGEGRPRRFGISWIRFFHEAGLFALLAISGFATWFGLRDFIIGLSAEPAEAAGTGALSDTPGAEGTPPPPAEALASSSPIPWTQEFLVAFLVITFTILMWLSVEYVRRRGHWGRRTGFAVMYLFLVLWSVGFGFGFWWKYLVSQTVSVSAIEQSFRAIESAAKRQEDSLQRVQSNLENAARISRNKSALERSEGNTCEGKPSRPSGRTVGPLEQNRQDLAQLFARQASTIRRTWIERLQKNYSDLRRDVGDVRQRADLIDDELERRQLFSTLGGQIEDVGASANDLSRLQIPLVLRNLKDYRGYVSREVTANIARGRGTWDASENYICNDSELQDLLDVTIADIRRLRPFVACPFEYREGSEATAYAVIRLWNVALNLLTDGVAATGIGDVTRSPSPRSTAPSASPSDQAVVNRFSDDYIAGEKATRCDRSGDITEFTNRDWIALFAAIGVDLGILIFTFGLPRPEEAEGHRVRLKDQLRKILSGPWRTSPKEFFRFVQASILVPERGGARARYVVIVDPNCIDPGDEQIIEYASRLLRMQTMLETANAAHRMRPSGALRNQVDRQVERILDAFAQYQPIRSWESEPIVFRMPVEQFHYVVTILNDMEFDLGARDEGQPPGEKGRSGFDLLDDEDLAPPARMPGGGGSSGAQDEDGGAQGGAHARDKDSRDKGSA